VRKSLSALEIFAFGLAAIMVVGWTTALILDWDRNVDNLPRTLAIIALLIGVGLYRRKRRLENFYTRVRS